MPKSEIPIEKMSYEKALVELENIVQQLEDQSLELDLTLKLFERGKTLIQHCQTLLDKADLKVRQLSEDSMKSQPDETE